MSIVLLNPGDTVTGGWFTDASSTVADLINNQTDATVRRDVFGQQHAPSMLARLQDGFIRRPKDYRTLTSPVTINTAFGGTTSADIIAWQDILTCDGAGGGWDLEGECNILVVATATLDTFATSDEDNAAYIAITRGYDGGAHALESTSDWRFHLMDDAGTDIDGLVSMKKKFHMWTVLSKTSSTPFTLDSVTLWAARGNQNWVLSEASLAVIGLHTG